jgi:hypothetical protein
LCEKKNKILEELKMKKSNTNNAIVKLTAIAGVAVVLSCAAIKAHMIKYKTNNTGSFDNPVIEVDTSTSTASMPEEFVAVAASTSTYTDITVIDDEDDSDLKSRLESIHDSDSDSLTDYIVSESEQSIDCTVWYSPDWYQDTRMSYMDWRTITDPDSEQWALQQYCYTDPTTGIRMCNGRYCIALGQEHTDRKGQYVDVTLDNGIVIQCIVADCKQYCDTQGGYGVIGADGGIIEFVVDEDYLPYDVTLMGSNEAQFDWTWQSPVRKVVVLDTVFNFQ